MLTDEVDQDSLDQTDHKSWNLQARNNGKGSRVFLQSRTWAGIRPMATIVGAPAPNENTYTTISYVAIGCGE
ncbi:hypothetical protein RE428_46290 [Marinobacter nanhaiticus D15-8W]|uniref:Uncharacterized protein n=1 Tax=Marinobacter nanhaiticus D15-8W TaxID=626887 RepID=N6W5Q2_9GAMM|nr:hypothetical protein J057_09311 [Marinobacter nanhaiticus D15-8W]BES73611.1 hypothetical protein RE428_46290 [Marinobacter nanhaiticus D15-8W]